ncbi:MAG: hypothetical protein BWY19_00840 [bacterium ADurb.Bin212]|nr:MAG: hypothetical protein BWY19_00840 [bacterium ADurb.Bin212]
MIDKKSQKFLLALSRQTLVDYFVTGKKIKIVDNELPERKLSDKAATFVTLTKAGELRGCVGSLKAKKALYEDIINNTLLAGFGDARFTPLKEEEIPEVKIEISILSEPRPYTCARQELLENIKANDHGVIIQKDFNQATYLPQVWQELPDKERFLETLCQKAGLEKNSWLDESTELFYYTVEKFSE